MYIIKEELNRVSGLYKTESLQEAQIYLKESLDYLCRNNQDPDAVFGIDESGTTAWFKSADCDFDASVVHLDNIPECPMPF